MAKKSMNFYAGIALLIALVLMFVRIPLINGDYFAQLIILIAAVYLIIKNH